MKMVPLCIALSLAMVVGSQVAAAACVSVPSLISDASFRRYPAAVSKGPWRAPDVRHSGYRTVLREAGRKAPDFAGRFRIIRPGCGSATECISILDRVSGRDYSTGAFNVISSASIGSQWVTYTGLGDDSFDRLFYRSNSRLLVVLGTRDDDASTSGATLYEWRDDKLHLIRFIPINDLCVAKAPA